MSFGRFATSIFAVFVGTLLMLGAAKTPSKIDGVWVTRPDGSLQCDEKDVGTANDPIAKAKAQLEKSGIKVLDAKKRNDGQMRAQMCGISTGNETSFFIPKADLPTATGLGFAEIAQ